MIIKAQIKLGSSDISSNLLSDIKDRLSERILNNHVYIDEIHYDGKTWITIDIGVPDNYIKYMKERMKMYVLGMVTGILIWSGVDVI